MTGWQPPQEPQPPDWRPVAQLAILAAMVIVALIVLALIGG